MMENRIRILLADDHAVVRKGIHEFLEESGDIDVIAEADDGAEALRRGWIVVWRGGLR